MDGRRQPSIALSEGNGIVKSAPQSISIRYLFPALQIAKNEPKIDKKRGRKKTPLLQPKSAFSFSVPSFD
ncbi:hypothetical protein RvY_14639 [Ramazzottius varieornatus]|uniref:Uncharacterized protein n=1 Tax=Ramazzottius varieornatus TaxID=947166 RepID=A0A1D1W0F5_RAMVA|nr:hypothetical protein RvY_14639 [Ramazzottius varieornatus]